MTYPQCNKELQLTMEAIKDHFKDNLEWAVVAQENHKEGGLHLHCLVSLKKQISYRSPNCLDHITGKHGNYKAKRNPLTALEYTIKDGNYLEHQIDVAKWMSAKKKKKALPLTGTIAAMVMNGATMEEVNATSPGFVMMNLQKILAYQNWTSRLTLRNGLKEWQHLHLMNGMNFQDVEIAQWLNGNLFRDRQMRQKQLYVYGPTNTGKTTLLLWLRQFCSIYILPTAEDFYCNYDDLSYDLVCIDEFRSQKTITWLNEFLGGAPMMLKQKGKPAYQKMKNLPCILCSNYSLRECYPNVPDDKFETISNRLLQIELTQPLHSMYKI